MDDTIYSTGFGSYAGAHYVDAHYSAHQTAMPDSLTLDSHLALTDHLIQGGMSATDAEHTLRAISPDLYDALSSHPYGTPSRLTFHNEGDVAVSIERGHPSEGQISVSMDALHDVLVRGMPYEGLEAVRDGLGAEGAHLSDLALMDSFGHAAIAKFGQDGFPHDTIQDVQQLLQNHVDLSGGLATVSRSEALQAYVIARDPSQTAALAIDNGNGRNVAVNLDNVRSALDIQPAIDPQTAIRQAANVDYQMTFGR